MLDALVSGLITGNTYALIAVGISLIFGVADLAGDLGAKDFAAEPYSSFHFARSQVLAAARAAGVAAIDSVTVQFRDLAQVSRDAESGARMGFDGKWAIHPSHLAPIHAAYTPTRAELERSLQILNAYAAADSQGATGAIVFGDEMVDAASLRQEWRKIAVAQKSGLIDEEFRLC